MLMRIIPLVKAMFSLAILAAVKGYQLTYAVAIGRAGDRLQLWGYQDSEGRYIETKACPGCLHLDRVLGDTIAQLNTLTEAFNNFGELPPEEKHDVPTNVYDLTAQSGARSVAGPDSNGLAGLKPGQRTRPLR